MARISSVDSFIYGDIYVMDKSHGKISIESLATNHLFRYFFILPMHLYYRTYSTRVVAKINALLKIDWHKERIDIL